MNQSYNHTVAYNQSFSWNLNQIYQNVNILRHTRRFNFLDFNNNVIWTSKFLFYMIYYGVKTFPAFLLKR